MIKEQIFSTPLYIISAKKTESIDKLKKLCINYYEHAEKNNENHHCSNKNGWQSDKDIHLNPSLNSFCDFILTHVKSILTNEYENESLTPYFDSMWVNINPKGSFNMLHIHPGCWISGVFYVSVPEKSGKLVFCDPRPAAEFEIFSSILKLKTNYEFSPKNGDLILFPSWLPHFVDVNLDIQHKLSISFNIGLK
jgi:uncharacterized protein (TIGR02466 family)